MLHIALWEPEIPPNTGNIARLCAATGTMLHLIGRLGFRLDERSLRRAGVDCWGEVAMRQHVALTDFETWRTDAGHAPERCFAFSAHAAAPYTDIAFRDGDALLFGSEGHGLPAETLARFTSRVFTIPMPAGKVRSLNLATAAGIVLYEALRQLHSW
jgi:tRNA (cytidine/uridine-2'-O-)-methyltransferase